ncbi:pentapeptide repeat-containing protein [Vibrio sp. SCSIO 43169]|nr:pentapeptide repeat-containing protein [Vibrio sp. SCSIO 43169]MCM5510507.1 pentapeptide repeat-containing protein [Vibrio sp. SCSIO 43169]
MNGTNNSEASLNTNEISSLDSRLKNCEDEIVGQEHRLLEVFRNVYRATVNNEWTANRKMGAWGALFRYVFFGRPAIVLTLGVGGFLALHANFLFFEQNKKLDLQNHLAIVDSYLVESQRNNQLFQLFPLIVGSIEKETSGDPKVCAPEQYPVLAQRGDTYCLSKRLYSRIIGLVNALSPYRWVNSEETSVESILSAGGSDSGLALWAGEMINSKLLSGSSGQLLAQDPVPLVTELRLSPERGQILITLHNYGVDLTELTAKSNTNFRYSYLRDAPLTDMYFAFADLVGSDFTEAKLDNSCLSAAEADSVNFSNASMYRADLSGIEARNSSFKGAFLTDVDFYGATLDGADFTDATLVRTQLSILDMSNVKGLTQEQLNKACGDEVTLPQGLSIPSCDTVEW